MTRALLSALDFLVFRIEVIYRLKSSEAFEIYTLHLYLFKIIHLSIIRPVLHIDDAQVAHLAVAFAVVSRAQIEAVLADLRIAVAIVAELELGEDV